MRKRARVGQKALLERAVQAFTSSVSKAGFQLGEGEMLGVQDVAND